MDDKMRSDKNVRRKRSYEIKENMKRKLGVLSVILLLAFIALSIRLIVITQDNNDEYSQKILAQQAYDSKTLNPKRGEIVDRNGTVLAASKENYNVILDVKIMLDEDEREESINVRNTTVKTLCDVFDLDASKVNEYIDQVPSSHYYIAKKGITYEEMKRFLPYTTLPDTTGMTKAEKEKAIRESLYNEGVVGVWFEKYYVRDYPQGSLACDVIGFSKSEGNAAYGLEEYYNSILCGTPGREYGYLSTDTTLEVNTIPAQDGQTLVTTLDANIQMIVAKYLKQFSDDHLNEAREGLGANNIGCIVMEVNTGNILAMESYPNFDLNDTMNLSAYYTQEQIDAMKADGTFMDACNKLWRNYCISDTYEPGSVMKPFTVAMGLETGKIVGNETYTCYGVLNVAGHDIHCHNTYGDGTLDVEGAVAKSCNVSLMHMAAEIGPEIFLKYQDIFNIGLKTNIDLSGEARTDNLVFNEKTLHESELATSSFGQGFNVSMIQMATGYCALVNGGYYYEPHVVSKIKSASGATVRNIEPRLIKQVISDSTSKKIIQYCNAVVDYGTGRSARPAGYMIGGKTGTAETAPRGTPDYVLSFIGHAPADDPQVVVYVVIDRPNVEKQENARYATVLARQIFTEILPYLNIPMTEELTESEIEELKALDLSVYTNRGPKQDVSQNDVSANVSGNVPVNDVPIWMSFPIDPVTGNRVDPNTNKQIDAETGDPIERDQFLP